MDPTIQAMFLETLQGLCSQNPMHLKQAECKMKEWETQPGFYTQLFNVVSNHNMDANMRLTAVLYFKIGVDKYWKKWQTGVSISEEEKLTIRHALLNSFNEPLNPIAIQLAVVTGKISRFDEAEWQELFPTLLRYCESTDLLVQHRAILTLHHVVKVLASKRISLARFRKLSTELYSFILNLWNNFTENFIKNVMEDASPEIINSNLQNALLTLKILRTCTTYGMVQPTQPIDNNDVIFFMNVVFDRARATLECRKRLKDTYLIEKCEKLIVNYLKLYSTILENFPFPLTVFFKPILDFTVYYLFTDAGDGLLFERFTLQCFNLIKGIILYYKVVRKSKFEEAFEPQNRELYKLFEPTTLINMCKKMLSHYFVLTKEDFEKWEIDPENFPIEEAGECWKYSLRPAMESFFVTLFNSYNKLLSPVLLEIIKEMNVIVPVDDFHRILHKEAMYNAIGLCVYEIISDEIDFTQWFKTTLSEELKIKHYNYRPLRRRVTWLVGKWAQIQLPSELRPLFYSDLVSLLHPSEDMAIRLVASTSLEHTIDDFHFSDAVVEQFRPFVQVMFDLLFTLLRECVECESKMHVLNVLTVMIERVGRLIIPYSKVFISYLPILWKDSADHDLLRCAIVASLVEIVKVYGGVSDDFYPFLIPIIQLGTDTSQQAGFYLLEDSLDLWETVLANSTKMTNELMQLYSNMFQLLEGSTENMRQYLSITLAYVLLAPELVLKTYGQQIVATIDSMISDTRQEGVIMFLNLIEHFIKANNTLGVEVIKPILPRIIQFILRDDDSPLVYTAYFTILARVLLASQQVFLEAIGEIARRKNESELNVWSSILDIWLTSVQHDSAISSKLTGLAFANLLTVSSQPVYQRISKILKTLLELLNDVMLKDLNGVSYDQMLLREGTSPTYFSDISNETEHDQRQNLLLLNDPVHTIVLKDYLQSQVLELKTQIGEIQYSQLLSVVDADTKYALNQFINLPYSSPLA